MKTLKSNSRGTQYYYVVASLATKKAVVVRAGNAGAALAVAARAGITAPELPPRRWTSSAGAHEYALKVS